MRVAARVLALALFFVPLPGAPAAAADQPLHQAFSLAASRYAMPVELLEAIGYVNTHWRMNATPSLDGSWGIMQLNDSPGPRNLPQAARLTGASVTALKQDARANILGGASLLARLATPRPVSLDGWRGAVAIYGGSQLFADQVFSTLRTGASQTLPGGERLELAAQSVARPAAAATATAASPDYSNASWVPANSANYTADFRPYSYPIQLIVIHVTEASYSSAISWFQNPKAQASAHYVVRSSDGAITQTVREHDIAWHAGNWDYNTRSIGIEHEGYVNDPTWFTDAMYQSSAQLAAAIATRYSIPIDRQHIVGHNEVPDPNNPKLTGGWGHHTDPGPNWNWSKYIALVQQYATPCTPAPGTASWQQLSGLAWDVGVGAKGTAWVIGTPPGALGYRIYRWTGSGWIQSDGAAVRIAVDPNGQPWVINMNQAIYWRGPGYWKLMPGAAYDVGVGGDGSVWVIGTTDAPGGHHIYRWNSSHSWWDLMPGAAVRVAVGPSGDAWVVNSAGSVYQWTAAGWHEVTGQKAVDIGVSSDDAPWIIGTNAVCGGYGIWRWDGTAWTAVPGGGIAISGAPNALAWMLDNPRQIYIKT